MSLRCHTSGCWLFVAAAMVLAGGCSRAHGAKVVRLAYIAGPTELAHRGAERFAELVDKRSNGSLEVKLYPSGQLGDERVLAEGLRLRSSDIIITGCAIVGWYAPEYSVIETPFAWQGYDHLERVWNGDIGERLRDKMKNVAGIDMLALWYRGPRYLTTTSRPVRTPDDLVGMKLRVPELDIYIKSWQAFGANTTPIPRNDIFMALKLGVVDGQENPLATICGNHLYEVQHYVMDTRHLIGFYVVCVGPYFDERFTAQERECLLAALRDATEWHNRELQQSEDEYKRIIREAGVEFVEVDREAFRRIAAEKIPLTLRDQKRRDIYRQIIECADPKE